MRKFTQPLACIVFWLLSLVPLALFTVEGAWPGADKIQLRPRAPFPQRVTPHINREFDRWFIDRIGLRLTLVSAGAAFHVGLLQRSTDRRVVIGRDGWLFYTDDEHRPATLADFRGALRFTESEIRAIERNLLAMRDTLAACGVRALVAVAPNKESIYGEYLNNTGARPATRLDDLLSRLSAPARSVILDLRVPLRAARAAAPDQPLYFKTDSHWNDLGAFYAYRAIIAALAQSMPVGDLALASLEKYSLDVKPFDDGDLAINILSSPGRFKDVQVLLRSKTQSAPSQEKLGGQVLVVGDSFSARLIPFIAQHFYVSRPATLGELPSQPIRADGPQPSAVVFETVESLSTSMLELNFGWEKFCPH
jgi:alginate O-acetyltransferase complex protein AlgJ